MRVRRLALFAAALLLALALAACSGGALPEAAAPEATSTPAPTATPEASSVSEASSTPAPTAVATPEAASTPTPTAIATPEATSTPEAASTLTPEQACANGVAVADPEAHPGLVADCEALLRARDALRGDASLDWGGGLAVADWEGVAVSGEPPRVTGLDLRGKRLTGSIPRELRRLRLGEVRLGGNALTGCVPSAFEDASGDAGLPWCLRYDRLDATGAVAEAGEWAILDSSGEVLATWEQLRSEAATLRVHQTDAGGTSWASEFGAVDVNDLFEWRMADDCWLRYRVTGAPAASASGASGRWEFPVEWMTYAATGAGCKGAVEASAVLSADEAAPSVIQSPDIATPVRHGPYLLYPFSWTGTLEEQIEQPMQGVPRLSETLNAIITKDISVARRFPLWRDPDLPAGWRLFDAETGTISAPAPDGYRARYVNDEGYLAATIHVFHATLRPFHMLAFNHPTGSVREMRLVDGHPGLVEYAPPGHEQALGTHVWIFHRATGLVYVVRGQDPVLLGSNIDRTIEIARSLYRTTAP